MRQGMLWMVAVAGSVVCQGWAEAQSAAPGTVNAPGSVNAPVPVNGQGSLNGQGTTTPGAVAGAPAPAVGALQPRPEVSFPPMDLKNFTAATPSVETVNSFLHALWGFDENRVWSVAAIQPTQAPGVVVVHVLVSEKTQPARMAQTTLFITPDGKHAIAGDVVRFGADPFAEPRALLAKGANGPARGAGGKQLELVEFMDLESKASKTAQATLDQLQQQFPQAHVVVEDMPLTRTHPFAYQAAAVGYCVRQSKGDPGYFAYAQSVMASQAELTKEKAETTLRAAATAAGADPAATLACAATPMAKAAVDAVVQLGTEVGVNDVPTLFVNGRALPGTQTPLPALERIVVFQGKLDGLAVQQQPALSTLK